MIVPADFWIYGRAEAAHSPRRQAGYQTLWRSAGLTPAMVDGLEAANRCFRIDGDPAGAMTRRIQLCRLSAEAYAVAMTLPQAPDPAVDAGGRPSFVCCAAIFPRAALAAPDFDPFEIAAAISSGLDFASLTQLLGPPGAAPVESFWQTRSTDRAPAERLPEKPSPGARALLEWGLDPSAREILAEPVLLCGAGVEIVLREAFFGAPAAIRHRFTFSTAMDGCNEPAQRFNLLATGRSAHHPRRVKLDVASGRWLASGPAVSPAALRYLAYRGEHPSACATGAWEAELALAGKASQGPGSAGSLDTVAAYLACHAEELAARADHLLEPLRAGLRRAFCDHLRAAVTVDRRLCLAVFEALKKNDRAALDNELVGWARARGILRHAQTRASIAWRDRWSPA